MEALVPPAIPEVSAKNQKALEANRAFQTQIVEAIKTATRLYQHTVEKNRILLRFIEERERRRTGGNIVKMAFGATVPPNFATKLEGDKKWALPLSGAKTGKAQGDLPKKKQNGRSTSNVRKRTRLFIDCELQDRTREKPPQNVDVKYIHEVLKDIPRVHVLNKFSVEERECLLKAIRLRAQLKLTHKACQAFEKENATLPADKRWEAKQKYNREYKRIKTIDDKTAFAEIQPDDWKYISQLMFNQLEPERAKQHGATPRRSSIDCQIYWDGVENAFEGPWTDAELKKLQQAVAKHKGFHWKKVAAMIGTKRPPAAYLREYQIRFNKDFKKSQGWSKEEDQHMVRTIRRITGDGDFNSVAANMDGRTSMQCFLRWRNSLRPGVSIHGTWRKFEDITLYLAVRARGQIWKDCVPHLHDVCGMKYGWRTDLSAQERFVNFMDPRLLFREFTQKEENDLIRIIQTKYKRYIEKDKITKRRRSIPLSVWEQILGEFQKAGNHGRNIYQIKRTWHEMMRRARRSSRHRHSEIREKKKKVKQERIEYIEPSKSVRTIKARPSVEELDDDELLSPTGNTTEEDSSFDWEEQQKRDELGPPRMARTPPEESPQKRKRLKG